jgi:hypothetical protein
MLRMQKKHLRAITSANMTDQPNLYFLMIVPLSRRRAPLKNQRGFRFTLYTKRLV